MKKSTLIKVAAQSILRNKLRTFLTMLGIVIGVAAVIVMVAVGYGAQASIRDQINSLGTNMIMVTPGTSMQGGVNRGSGTFNRLTIADAEKLEREGTLLSAVSPIVATFGQVIGGAGNWRTRINGVATEYQTIRDCISSPAPGSRRRMRARCARWRCSAQPWRTLCFPTAMRSASRCRSATCPSPSWACSSRRARVWLRHGRHRAHALHHGAGAPARPIVPDPDRRQHLFAAGHSRGAGRDPRHHARVAPPRRGGRRRFHASATRTSSPRPPTAPRA